MDLRVADPRVEYRTNPINVFTAAPRFSWKIQSGRKNVLQTSYHIEVAEDSGFSLPIWDSGKVCSKESHLVAYNGDALKSSSRYYWRVKINDNHGEESPWSETAFFETTLLSNADGKRFLYPPRMAMPAQALPDILCERNSPYRGK